MKSTPTSPVTQSEPTTQAGAAASRAGQGAEPPPVWPAPETKKKNRYHHGNLRDAALAHARTIVARGGPSALTLRGLARDLGVSHPALRYWFGSIQVLRATVAQAVLEEATKHARLAAHKGDPPKELARRWSAYAAENPNLYRLASGETWHRRGTDGLHGGAVPVRSPRRQIEDALTRRSVRFGLPEGEREWARDHAVLLHALALARVDSVPAQDVERLLDRWLAA
jgi:AcrR family transcriptional regulator